MFGYTFKTPKSFVDQLIGAILLIIIISIEISTLAQESIDVNLSILGSSLSFTAPESLNLDLTDVDNSTQLSPNTLDPLPISKQNRTAVAFFSDQEYASNNQAASESLSIKDLRGTNAGWNLSARVSNFVNDQATTVPYNQVYLDSETTLDGSNTNFLDNSSFNHNINPITWSDKASPVHSTNNPATGLSSIFYPVNAGHLETNYSDNFNFYDQDFTIETWIKPIDSTFGIASFRACSDNNRKRGWYLEVSNWYLRFRNVYDGNYQIFSTQQLSVNEWYHVAFAREGEFLRAFINGQLVGTRNVGLGTSFVPEDTLSTKLMIGGGTVGCTSYGYGSKYLDNFRISKSIARYTNNFNPTTDTYLADPLNTLDGLLLLGENVDNNNDGLYTGNKYLDLNAYNLRYHENYPNSQEPFTGISINGSPEFNTLSALNNTGQTESISLVSASNGYGFASYKLDLQIDITIPAFGDYGVDNISLKEGVYSSTITFDLI